MLYQALETIERVARSVIAKADFDGYQFGSTLRTDENWNDIDILIVCNDSSDVSLVRQALQGVCKIGPIDLMIMSSAEENELNFVAEQRCRHLFAVGGHRLESGV